MSNPLIIAAVTAVFKHLLENELVNLDATTSIGSDVIVSALPPDQITPGEDERAQLNLFLHQITTSNALSLPGSLMSDRDAEHFVRPSLALDLHYLLTAYGGHDLQIELLLGYAIHLMNTTPQIKWDSIQKALQVVSSADHSSAPLRALAALAQPDFDQQIEQITICPQFFNTQELATLWSAMQTRYRPSVVYKVSLVVTEKSM